MSAMAELSELYEESNDLQMDVMAGEGDLPQMEVGGGGREEGPMEEEAAPPAARRPGPGPGELAGPAAGAGAGFPGEDAAEDWEDWEDDYGRPEEEPRHGAGYRVSAALEEANKVFLRTARARGAAPDGGWQAQHDKTPFDQLAFIEELFSLMVVNRLTEELGCDEIIDRE